MDIGHATEFGELVYENHQDEIQQLCNELKGMTSYSLFFDGATRVCESLGVVIRVVSPNFQIMQRCVGIELLKRALNAKSLSGYLMRML